METRPKKRPKILKDFILPALDCKLFGSKLQWDDLEPDVFRVHWLHMANQLWNENDTIVFRNWDLLKGHYNPNNHNYLRDAKQRFRSALYKLDIIEELSPIKISRVESYKRYRILKEPRIRQPKIKTLKTKEVNITIPSESPTNPKPGCSTDSVEPLNLSSALNDSMWDLITGDIDVESLEDVPSDQKKNIKSDLSQSTSEIKQVKKRVRKKKIIPIAANTNVKQMKETRIVAPSEISKAVEESSQEEEVKKSGKKKQKERTLLPISDMINKPSSETSVPTFVLPKPAKKTEMGDDMKKKGTATAMSSASGSRMGRGLRRKHTSPISSSSTSSSSNGSSSSSSSTEASESENETESPTKTSSTSGSAQSTPPKARTVTCKQCEKTGLKSSFWHKNKLFCSFACSRAFKKSETLKAKANTKPAVVKSSPPSPSTSSNSSGLEKKFKADTTGSFDWKLYLVKAGFAATPVSCFKHVALSDAWNNITINLKVEVINTDCVIYNSMVPAYYWVASVIKIDGYMSLLRYEGFGEDTCKDFWVNMCTDEVHPVGWCATQGKPLIPPKSIEQKHEDWKQFLVLQLTGAKTLPSDFTSKVEESINNYIKKGMKLEVVDKNRISSVRVATVSEVIGGRLHVTYEDCETIDEGFWCHERSPLIHPVGWAQVIGHDLKATPEYARQSLHKTLFREFEVNDATWDLFLPVLNPVTDLKFKVGMKLEAIDPLNLSTICVATVTRVLRNNYLMIGIDGMMAANGSDWFCYHASSPCIFPVGFCESNSIKLTPPRGYKGEFKWNEYLKQTKATSAPVGLFKKDIPDHGFKEGMQLEAVDLMEPRLICVGSVTKVVGRLLRIHFDGWEDAYDQWCDCESPDLFPVGWCQLVGYRLEPPRSEISTKELAKKKKNFIYRGRKRRRGNFLGRRSLFHSKQLDQKERSDASSENNTPDKTVNLHDISSTSQQTTLCMQAKEQSSSEVQKNSSRSDLRSPLAGTDPSKWSVSDVALFLRINECGSYSQIFTQEKVDGPKLLGLNKDSLMAINGMKVGPSVKILHLIQQLKLNKKAVT